MTISDDELARLEALTADGDVGRGYTLLRDNRPVNAVVELVAEVRSLRRGNADLGGVQAQLQNERDALRAENERLRRELAEEKRRLLADDERRMRIRAHVAAEAEAAELRASLADAVGKIAAMEPVVEAASDYTGFCFGPYAGREPFGRDDRRARLKAAIDAYEASLPGIVKVEP